MHANSTTTRSTNNNGAMEHDYYDGYWDGCSGAVQRIGRSEAYYSGYWDGFAEAIDGPELPTEDDDLDDWRPALDEPDLECCF